MSFAAYDFIFLFLPIVLCVNFLLAKYSKAYIQHSFLVAASLFFYAYFKIEFLPIIVASIIINYGIAKLITVRQKESDNRFPTKALLVTGILFNVALLGYFKYYDFFIANVNAVTGLHLPLHHLILPLGISFFTFQQLSFLISVYKCEEKLEDFIDYCLFVSFFAQLVAGPIVLYSEMIPQFKDPLRRNFQTENFAKGIYCFIIGLFKKLVIADTLALFADNGYAANQLAFASAWAVSLAYTLQIYFDFSGYSDMAIGLGKMMNIDLPVNFDSPYKSASITEFWKRWHITLGRALRTYIYIPLGGNRKGLALTCVNLIATFLVSGLWHGAAWTFILWGTMHGLVIAFERIFKKQLEKIPHLIRVSGTFLLVNFFWVLFRAGTFAKAKAVYKAMFNIKNIQFMSLANLNVDGIIDFMPPQQSISSMLFYIAAALIIAFFCKNTMQKTKSFKFTYVTAFGTSVMFVLSILHLSRLSPFIYFNF